MKASDVSLNSGTEKKTDWFILIWMMSIHLLAIPALFTFSWDAFFVFLALYFVTACLGITFGFHRLLSHRAFKANKWVERFAAFCGTLALQGSILEWVAHHRMHHAGADTDNDPHDSRRGFWYCHMLWLFNYDPKFDEPSRMKKFARDIYKDSWLKAMSHPVFMIGAQVVLGLILLAIGGASWVWWGIFFRLVVVYHVTWFVNSATHFWGYKNFDIEDRSRNLWWVGVLAWGEGWHNNHHAHQNVARAGIKWWEVDVTYYIIKLLETVGLVSDVVPPKSEGLIQPYGASGKKTATAS